MARPKDADSARTYDAILEAARELLFEDGDEPAGDVSLRRVAAVAGVSSGTLSYYFPSKEDLLERCLDTHYQRLGELVDALVAQASDGALPPERFVAQATRLLYRLAFSDRAEMMLRTATNASRGATHFERRTLLLDYYLRKGANALVAIMGVEMTEARLVINSIMALTMRYVTTSDEELAAILGRGHGEGTDGGRRRLEDHVIDAAVRIAIPR